MAGVGVGSDTTLLVVGTAALANVLNAARVVDDCDGGGPLEAELLAVLRAADSDVLSLGMDGVYAVATDAPADASWSLDASWLTRLAGVLGATYTLAREAEAASANAVRDLGVAVGAALATVSVWGVRVWVRAHDAGVAIYAEQSVAADPSLTAALRRALAQRLSGPVASLVFQHFDDGCGDVWCATVADGSRSQSLADGRERVLTIVVEVAQVDMALAELLPEAVDVSDREDLWASSVQPAFRRVAAVRLL